MSSKDAYAFYRPVGIGDINQILDTYIQAHSDIHSESLVFFAFYVSGVQKKTLLEQNTQRIRSPHPIRSNQTNLHL